MAITINGNGTITGYTPATVADGGITAAKLASGVGGKTLQISSVNKTDTTSTTSTSYVDIAGITLNITPQTNSKVLIQFCYCYGASGPSGGAIRIVRIKGGTTTYLAVADTAGYNSLNDTMISYVGSADQTNKMYHQGFHHLDQNVGGDGSTQITYKLQWRCNNGTIYLGRDDTGSISDYAGGNEFTLTEYAA